MTTLILIAQLEARPGREEELEAVLRGLVAPSRADEGCLAYDLHRDIEVPSRFALTEAWASRELWQKHMETPHLDAFRAKADDLVASWNLQQLRQIA